MDVAVILTYRCNSKCSMCNVWQNPTLPEEEVSLPTLEKIPSGIDYLNLTGGEPTLRQDLTEIVDVLYPKATKLEISSNGLYAERLEPIIRKYPNIKIRLSLDGLQPTSDHIRGEQGGFEKKVAALLHLKELGGCDLGFGVTIQDDNAAEVIELFKLTQTHGFELATTTLHNGFQFHKNDNVPYDRRGVAKHIEDLIVEMLRTNNVKNWFRAYLTLGLLSKVLGQPRLLKCSAGADFAFVDPWGDVFPCNVRPDLKMGNLEEQSWDNIVSSERARDIRAKVSHCNENCWMVGSAKTAMRNPYFAKLPRWRPLSWVLYNKARVLLNRAIDFHKYVDYSRVPRDAVVPQRISYLHRTGIKKVQTKWQVHYQPIGEFHNR